ncbi:hypothetical protein A5N15_07250 [Rothia kristinae]|uniref:Uncharacterized protein n=1 Tax=Rothia kristinae TaxID=37923 RepID=A0A657IUP2_9MICC|nr:hypothetical protein A5N15_07250 [Rothia kristinae]
MQQAIRAAKAGDWRTDGDGVVVGSETLEEPLGLQPGEFELETVVDESAGTERAVAVIDGGFLVLDTHLTPELQAEGTARDVIRAIQQAARTRTSWSRTGSAPW